MKKTIIISVVILVALALFYQFGFRYEYRTTDSPTLYMKIDKLTGKVTRHRVDR